MVQIIQGLPQPPSALEMMLGGIGQGISQGFRLENLKSMFNVETSEQPSVSKQVQDKYQEEAPEYLKAIEKTKSYSSTTPSPNFKKIAIVSTQDDKISNILAKEAESILKIKSKEADRHEKITAPYITEMQKVSRTLPQKEILLNTMNDAISKGGSFTWDYIAEHTNLPMFKTAAGSQLDIARKEFFLNDLERIKGGRINQFLEKTLRSAYADFGKKPKANAVILAVQEATSGLLKKESELVNEVSDKLEARHGFIHRSLEPIVTSEMTQIGAKVEQSLMDEIDKINKMDDKALSAYLKQKTHKKSITPEGKVTVISPEGKSYSLPADKAQEAVKAGWKIK